MHEEYVHSRFEKFLIAVLTLLIATTEWPQRKMDQICDRISDREDGRGFECGYDALFAGAASVWISLVLAMMAFGPA